MPLGLALSNPNAQGSEGECMPRRPEPDGLQERVRPERVKQPALEADLFHLE